MWQEFSCEFIKQCFFKKYILRLNQKIIILLNFYLQFRFVSNIGYLLVKDFRIFGLIKLIVKDEVDDYCFI